MLSNPQPILIGFQVSVNGNMGREGREAGCDRETERLRKVKDRRKRR